MKKPQIKSLQGLRAIAALLIIFSHLAIYIPSIYSLCLGANGVSVFIMLSGFCTFYAYENNWETAPKTKDILAYVQKKVGKFYPLHFITYCMTLPIEYVALSVTMAHLSLPQKVMELAVKSIPNLFLIQSFIPMQEVYFSFNQVAWYLSDTIFFCICTPFLLYVLHQMKPEHIGRKMVLSFCSLFLFQIIISLLLYKTAWAHAILYIAPWYRIGEFIQGALLGCFFVHCANWKPKYHVVYSLAEIGSVVFFLILMLKWKSYPAGLGYSVVFIPATALLLITLAMGQGIISQILCARPLCFLANISFELFLVHFVVFRYLEIFRACLPAVNNAAYVCIAVTLAVLASYIMHLLLGFLSHMHHSP